MPKVKCTIEEVVPIKKQKQNPIIAHYQNGEISDEFAQNFDVCLANDTQMENESSVLLTVSKDNVYDGYINKGFPTELKRTFIAIRKANSDKLKLIEVNECNLMSYQYGNCAKKETITRNDISSMSTESARRILFKDFGGKKAMKVLDRKEKMKINVDVVRDQLDKTLLELNQTLTEKGDEFDKVKEEQDQILEEMIPEMNKEATKLVDVYNLAELVGKDVLESLKSDAINVLKTKPDDLPIKRKFLATIIQSIQRSKNPDDADNLLKVETCIYIDALITYFKQVNDSRQNRVVKLQNISQIAPKLESIIKKKFSQPNISKLMKTNYVVHKLTCYIIVLSLLITERYEMDIQHIIEEIGISKTSLFKIINSVAVRPKAKTNIVAIRLPSALKTFSTNFRRRRTL